MKTACCSLPKRFVFSGLIAWAVLLLAACGGGHQSGNLAPSAEEQKIYEEVMAIHDAVMPKISTIVRHKKTLNKALTAIDSVAQPDLRLETMQTIQDLMEADDAMMDWMAAFDEQEAKVPEKEKMAYLAAEKTKIQEVGNKMMAAIERAEKLLLKLNASKE